MSEEEIVGDPHLVEKLRLADRPERVLENNISVISAISLGAESTAFHKDLDKIQLEDRLTDEEYHFVPITGEPNLFVAPVSSSNNTIIGYITLDLQPLAEENLLDNLEPQTVNESLVYPEEDTIRAMYDEAKSDADGDPMNWSLVAELYDVQRIGRRQRWEKLAARLTRSQRRQLREFRRWKDSLFESNYERMMSPLLKKQFSLQSEPFHYLTHITNVKITDKLISGRQLTRNKYPEGFEKHVIEAIIMGDKRNLARLTANYWRGVSPDPDKGFGAEGDSPDGSTTKFEEMFLGMERSVYLATDFSYRNTSGVDQLVYKYDPKVIENRGAMVSPMDVSTIIPNIERRLGRTKSAEDILIAAVEAKINNSLDLQRWREFFKSYCEHVFDSEESMRNYLDRLFPEQELTTFESTFGMRNLSDSERARIEDLWVEHGIFPPFLNEIVVRNELPVKEAAVVEQNQPFLVDGRYHRLSDRLGSNEAYVVEDTSNNERMRYYVKLYSDKDQVYAEELATQFYSEFAVSVPNVKSGKFDGRVALFSEMIDGLKESYTPELAEDERFLRGFVIDAFVGNIDIPQPTNTQSIQGGEYYRIDNGSVFGFRAQGKRRDFSEEVTELFSMRGKENYYGKYAYKNISDEMINEQVTEFLNIFSEDRILELVEGQRSKGMSDKFAEELREVLLKRREYLERFVQI